MATLDPSIIPTLKSQIDAYTTGAPPKVPGLVYTVVNASGDIIFSHASGKRGIGSKDPMTLDSVFWIASCTKMITGIACMQLVEQGKLALDDVELVEKLAPELRDVKVIEEHGEGEFRLVEKERGISLRMLLDHTGKQVKTIYLCIGCL